MGSAPALYFGFVSSCFLELGDTREPHTAMRKSGVLCPGPAPQNLALILSLLQEREPKHCINRFFLAAGPHYHPRVWGSLSNGVVIVENLARAGDGLPRQLTHSPTGFSLGTISEPRVPDSKASRTAAPAVAQAWSLPSTVSTTVVHWKRCDLNVHPPSPAQVHSCVT